jgi:CRP/FNR family transcriptional regulator
MSLRHDTEFGNPLLHLHLTDPPPTVRVDMRHLIELDAPLAVAPGSGRSPQRAGDALPAGAAAGARVVHGHAPGRDDSLSWTEVLVPLLGWARIGEDYESTHVSAVARSRGAHVLLEPVQHGERLPVFVAPYAEIDGMPHPVDWSLRFQRRVAAPEEIGRRPSAGLLELLRLLDPPPPQVRVRPGAQMEPSPGAELYALLEGSLRLQRLTRGGRRLDLERVCAPSLISASRLLHARGEAESPARLMVLRRLDAERLMLSAPHLAVDLVRVLGGRLAETEDRLEYLAYHSVISRVCLALLRLRDQEDGCVTGVTHQQLAEMVGTHRETVTKTLRSLAACGAVSIRPRLIHVRNASLLAEYLEG